MLGLAIIFGALLAGLMVDGPAPTGVDAADDESGAGNGNSDGTEIDHGEGATSLEWVGDHWSSEGEHADGGEEPATASGNDSIVVDGKSAAALVRHGPADFSWQDESGIGIDAAPTLFLGGDEDDLVVATGIGVEISTGGGTDTVDLTGATQALVNAGPGDVVFGSDVASQVDINVVITGTGTFYGGQADERGIAVEDGAELHGGGGNDTLESDSGSGQLFGGDGNDLLVASRTKASYLDSSTDSISAYADKSVDHLFGGAGDDILLLSRSDVSAGGDGNDQFTVFNTGSDGGAAVVCDFNPAEDMLLIYSGDSIEYSDAQSPSFELVSRISIQEADGNTHILDGSAEIASLAGVTGLSVGLMHLQPDGSQLFTTLDGSFAACEQFDVLVSTYPSASS